MVSYKVLFAAFIDGRFVVSRGILIGTCRRTYQQHDPSTSGQSLENLYRQPGNKVGTNI